MHNKVRVELLSYTKRGTQRWWNPALYIYTQAVIVITGEEDKKLPSLVLKARHLKAGSSVRAVSQIQASAKQ